MGTWNARVGPSACPSNSTAVTGGCQCNSGYKQNTGGTACELIPPVNKCSALSGTSAGDYSHDSGVNEAGTAPIHGDFSLSVGGCKVEVSNPHCVKNSGGWFVCTGDAQYTGAECATAVACASNKPFGVPTATPTPPDANPPSPNPADPGAPTPKPEEPRQAPCPAGQASGQYNGTTICAPTGADGTAGTSTGGVKNPDGSGSTVNNATTCKTAASCTTNSTTCTVLSGGSAGSCSTTTTTESVQSLCSKDKGNTVCAAGAGGNGTKTAFSGDCKAGFKAVSDDAVLNAMAQEQHKRNCQLLDTSGAESIEVKAEMDKTGNRTADSGNNSTVNVGPSSFDTSDALGGGGCNLNKTISVWRGYSVTLPFNNACDVLGYFGNVLVAVGLLLAARIVARG